MGREKDAPFFLELRSHVQARWTVGRSESLINLKAPKPAEFLLDRLRSFFEHFLQAWLYFDVGKVRKPALDHQFQHCSF